MLEALKGRSIAPENDLGIPALYVYENSMKKLPSIQVYALGGTIAMVPGGGAGVQPSLTAEALIAAVPAIEDVAHIRATTLAKLGSANLTVGIIADVCRKAEQTDCDAVIVTQGTDTIEETAFVASLLYKGDKPLIFTAAMKTPNMPGADGPANLYNAALTAVSGLAPKVSVVMNSEIHDPWLVKKGHTCALSTFVSDFKGPVGQVFEGNVQINYKIPERLIINVDTVEDYPIALLTAGIDLDDRLLNQVVNCGYKGLVIEGFGSGRVTEAWADTISEIVKDIPVLLSTRVAVGPVQENTYGYKGAEIDLIRRGCIPCGALKSTKARLLLGLLLASGSSNWKAVLTHAIKSV